MESANRDYPVAQVPIIINIVISIISIIISIVISIINIVIRIVSRDYPVAQVPIISIFFSTLLQCHRHSLRCNEKHHYDNFCPVDCWHRLPYNPPHRADSCPLPGADADAENYADAENDAENNAENDAESDAENDADAETDAENDADAKKDVDA